ncbi:ABC transporter substrate-binding protein [Aminobacter sp. UC22_36]|uniref:ABC transporter substrate-binding protein n=1 Tax=Aminobacter sp. UC22_36 TaxID=3374549 RepID=UPI0037563819
MYAPQYAGISTGLFSEQSIHLEFYRNNGSCEDTVGAVNRGEVDLLLGTCLYGVRLAETGVSPVVVAQSNQQTRHVLAQRADCSWHPQWSDLRGKAIVVHPGQTPTAWAAFAYALNNSGISLGEVKPIVGYTAEDAISEFVRGVGDVLFIDGDTALRDDLRIALPVSRQAGRLPWSVYMMDRRSIEPRRELLRRFAQALDHSLKWLRAETTETIARALAPFFPDVSPGRLLAVVELHRSLDLWAASSTLQLDQVKRWSDALELGGLIAPGRQLREYLDVL